ncbi:MAG: hypothetical protein N3F09_04515 [Bacteroidia bacterium]|nr:hypothetical protein [Bacteroidia bacterium]
MPKIITIKVKESEKELKLLLKKLPPFFHPRIEFLLKLKKKNGEGSKLYWAKVMGVQGNTIQKWRTLYRKKGIKGLITLPKKGFKITVIDDKQRKYIKDIVKSKKSVKSIGELTHILNKKFKTNIKYATLLAYCKRHHPSFVKEIVNKRLHYKKKKK